MLRQLNPGCRGPKCGRIRDPRFLLDERVAAASTALVLGRNILLSNGHTGAHPRRKPRARRDPDRPLIPTASTPTTGTVRPAGSFSELGVPPRMVAALSAGGVTIPFPIQRATIPDALAGHDVLGQGQTGSGKTVAFAVPMVATLSRAEHHRTPRQPAGLVLVPTRELAT